jgi:hypothetical protein
LRQCGIFGVRRRRCFEVAPRRCRHAAADYRELVDRVGGGTARSSSTVRAPGCGLTLDDWLAGNLDVWARMRQIRAVLGAWACTLLEAALVRDLSWAALGRQYRCDPKTARAWVIAAIKALRDCT